jgi:DNA invertase Pin-like site-specific DNA recombinase
VTTSELITPAHLTRQALIYVRQSTPQQVLTNTESQRLQYALRQRAVECGWPATAVEVIDTDLGLSGRTTDTRAGFADLVARVTLGQVGIIFAYDATRLSRNCADWYQLLDLCGFRRCLIGDRDGVYDPSSINGRLLLGLKGQISELEAHTIKARLTAGLRSKAARGELALSLPVGLVRDAAGRVTKHPDVAVRERIELVFATLLRVRSVYSVLREFTAGALLLPRRDRGADDAAVVWRRPTEAALLAFLRNPAYAGTYVYGRTEFRPSRVGGPHRKYPLPPDRWQACIPDKYPAYVDRATFDSIQETIRDNYQEYQKRRTRGVPRAGSALLQGIAYCGACGHKLNVVYQSRARYVCNFHKLQHHEKECQRVSIATADEVVVRAFWEALAPAELDRYDVALAALAEQRRQFDQARGRQLERLRYEARLAEKQYRAVDPENRLVAAELERRWEQALRAVSTAEAEVARHAPPAGADPIDEALRRQVSDIRLSLPERWADGKVANARKKAMLRALVEKVVLHRPTPDRVRIRIVWVGGDTTTIEHAVAVPTYAELSNHDALVAEVTRRARAGQTDEVIAAELTAGGFHAPLSDELSAGSVGRIRQKHGVLSRRGEVRRDGCPGWLTVGPVATRIEEHPGWLYQLIRAGRLVVQKDPVYQVYLFPDNKTTLSQVKALARSKRSSLTIQPRASR